jgi:TPP-dependent pyruvate/acetoin dehydrogenase alpha subunit
MPGFVVDGNDVLACFQVMKDAHDRARAGDWTTLIECKTYRFLHTSDDDDKSWSRERSRSADTTIPSDGSRRTSSMAAITIDGPPDRPR